MRQVFRKKNRDKSPLFIIIYCSQNGLWGSFGEQLARQQSALSLKISGFIRFIVNLDVNSN